jgi:hypothetical protein
MKLTKKLISVILAVVMLVCMSTNVFAANIDDSASNFIRNSINAELMAKEDSAQQKYDHLIDDWSADDDVGDDDLRYPSFYGGAYLDEDKNLVIQVTYLDDDVKKYFEDRIDTNGVVFQEVKYSYKELLDQMDVIVQNMSSGGALSDINGAGISSKSNGINIYFDPNSISTNFTRSNYDDILWLDSISFIESQPTTACGSVEAGSRIDVNNGYRSVGFWAKDADGNLGIVTAPHTTMTVGTSVSIDSTVFGEASQVSFGDKVDCAFVKRTSTDFTTTRYISGLDMSIVGYSKNILEGSTIYTVGAKTGVNMGTVENSTYATTYSGATISDTLLTSNMVNHGDSGGVALKYTESMIYIAGIIIAKKGTGDSPAPGIICKYTNIVNALDVNMY